MRPSVPPLRTCLSAVLPLLTLAVLAGCGQGPGGPPAPTVEPTPPTAVNTPPPDYPLELACYEQGGTAGLILKIGLDGRARDIRVESSSGHPQLDQAALAAVETWEFRPATRGGQPVETDLRVPVKFTPPADRPAECYRMDEQR